MTPLSKKSSIQVENINNSQDSVKMVDVLYQKMGDRWYAFSLVGEDVFVGSVSQADVNYAASTHSEIEKLIVTPAGNENLHEAA